MEKSSYLCSVNIEDSTWGTRPQSLYIGTYIKRTDPLIQLSSTEKDFATNKSKDDNGTYFMFQASLIGAEFGKQFRGFAELGVGEQGFLLAGIRYKF